MHGRHSVAVLGQCVEEIVVRDTPGLWCSVEACTQGCPDIWTVLGQSWGCFDRSEVQNSQPVVAGRYCVRPIC
jgi:hypothetical protein